MTTLRLKGALEAQLDLDGLTPDRCALLATNEIARLPLRVGGEPAAVGNLFTVDGGNALSLRIEGDLGRAIRVGARMTRGELVVEGNVGDEAGLAMSGGTLRINGNAGARLAAALPGGAKGMTGGEIVVSGSAAEHAAARVRRGLVVVGGDVGEEAGRGLIAGTLIVLGRCGAHPGRGSKRGSILATGPIDPPPTYRYACTYEPPYVRLVLTYLRRQYGVGISDAVVSGRYRRYCGDTGEPGKGEILQYAG